MTTTTKYYADVLKGWQVKTMGQKPTADQLEAAHLLGCRPGVQALHIAMALRDQGCTVQQFCTAGSCGPANNKRRELISHKLITVSVEGKPYAYVAKLTAKGTAHIAKAKQAAADAAAGTEAPKAKKAGTAIGKAKGRAKVAVTNGKVTTTPQGPVQPGNGGQATPATPVAAHLPQGPAGQHDGRGAQGA